MIIDNLVGYSLRWCNSCQGKITLLCTQSCEKKYFCLLQCKHFLSKFSVNAILPHGGMAIQSWSSPLEDLEAYVIPLKYNIAPYSFCVWLLILKTAQVPVCPEMLIFSCSAPVMTRTFATGLVNCYVNLFFPFSSICYHCNYIIKIA